jgi:hypothetical protein
MKITNTLLKKKVHFKVISIKKKIEIIKILLKKCLILKLLIYQI